MATNALPSVSKLREIVRLLAFDTDQIPLQGMTTDRQRTALAVVALTATRTRTTSSLPPAPTSPNTPPPADPGLIPLTVAEAKRLINLLTRTWHSIEHHLRWHLWRRRHQARARWFHHRTRLNRRCVTARP
jgi:hypothetical protein